MLIRVPESCQSLHDSLSQPLSTSAPRRIQPFNYSWSRAILHGDRVYVCVRPERHGDTETFAVSLRSESITVQRCRAAVAVLTLHVYALTVISSHAEMEKCVSYQTHLSVMEMSADVKVMYVRVVLGEEQ